MAVLVTDRAGLVREDNPGPMTLEGTNTWVLAAPGAGEGVVVDPGEDDAAHRAAVLAHLRGRGLRCALVVLTHHHHDHAGGLDAFLAALRPQRPAVLRATETSRTVDGLRLDLLRTPGHTADSTCVLLPQEGSLLTGDVVLGRGSTVLAVPAGPDDDPVGDHLASLRRLAALDGVARLLPGHGPVRTDPADVLRGQLAHRLERLEQVRAAVAGGARGVEEVVDVVHAGLDAGLRRAARASITAQLHHLGAEVA